MSRQVEFKAEHWPLRSPFRIAGRTFTQTGVVHVVITQGDRKGHGEGAGVYYHGETPETMLEQLRRVGAQLVAEDLDRRTLQRILPAGGARNAVDCALWDLEAQSTGVSAREVAGLRELLPLVSTFTLSADDPEAVARAALDFPEARALKLKLAGDGLDIERIRAARGARPNVWLSVDANQAFDLQGLMRLVPVLVDSGVRLIEQPLPAGRDSALRDLDLPIPLAADESAQCAADIPSLVGIYDMVNIKLDKCGGLTEALDMARLARRFGLDLMVGNMCGTSLAMAPACVLGQLCDVVDLDGPMLLAADREPSLMCRNGTIGGSEQVWGAQRTGARMS
jgi:L-alanine-DL-glutamate epimerase-like enolase superfamily enzyme